MPGRTAWDNAVKDVGSRIRENSVELVLSPEVSRLPPPRISLEIYPARRCASGSILLLVLLAATAACRPPSTSNGGGPATGDPAFDHLEGGHLAGGHLAGGGGKPAVFVVNYPLEFFASRIGGDLVDVEFPVPADVDPAFWRPADADVARIQQADLILLNGAGYAKWTQQVSLPESRLVDTSQSFADQLIRVEDGVVHSHGPGGPHSHEGVAFTTWLDPRLAISQATAVHAAFVRLLPDNQAALDANFQRLKQELEQLDRQLGEVAPRYQGEPLLASHPVYQYLARRCGWNLRSVHWEPDEVPDAGQWETLAKLRETHPSKWMLWEAPPRRETADKLAAAGVTSIVFETCGNRPARDYLQAMRENIHRLAAIFPE